jgi:hypothetical protein
MLNHRQRVLISAQGRWSVSRIGENPIYGLTRGDGKRVVREEKTAPIFYSTSPEFLATKAKRRFHAVREI